MRVRLFSLLCATALLLLGAVPASAGSEGHGYLALGDSVPFGFHPNPALWPDIRNMVGYPEIVAQKLNLEEVNASCPGEATGGFISLSGTDNGCHTFRQAFPLHVAYKTSQLDFALSYLRANPRTRLVTLMLGANDVFHLQHICTPEGSTTPDLACVGAGLPGVVATMQANLTTILADIRATGFRGLLIAVTYYALDYRDTSGSVLLNTPMIAAAAANGALVADGLEAWSGKAAGGSSCTAGLLLPAFPPVAGTCDVHPTLLGHTLLADEIVETITDSCPAHSALGCLYRNSD